MRVTYRFIFYIIIPILVLYWLYTEGSNIEITFGFYKFMASSVVLVLIIIVIFLITFFVKMVKNLFYALFVKIDLSATLADYIKNIEISSQFDKEIHLQLIKNVNDLKTLKMFVRLNELVQKRHFQKALSLIKHKRKNNKLKDLLNYTKVQIMLMGNRVEEAENICRYHLNEGKVLKSWAFLKLLDIFLNNNAKASQFRLLSSLLTHKKNGLDKNSYNKVYCLIHYYIAKMEYNNDVNSAYLSMVNLVKRYPSFIPAYTLIIKHLMSINKEEEAREYIVKSWGNNITYENTIAISNLLYEEDKDFYKKSVLKLLNSIKSHNTKKDEVLLLSAIVNTIYSNYIDAMDNVHNIKDTDSKLYKLTKLFIYLKENKISSLQDFIKDFANNIKINWWDEYIQS